MKSKMLKKTMKNSYFKVIGIDITLKSEQKNNIVLQIEPMNEKQVLVELISKDDFEKENPATKVSELMSMFENLMRKDGSMNN